MTFQILFTENMRFLRSVITYTFPLVLKPMFSFTGEKYSIKRCMVHFFSDHVRYIWFILGSHTVCSDVLFMTVHQIHLAHQVKKYQSKPGKISEQTLGCVHLQMMDIIAIILILILRIFLPIFYYTQLLYPLLKQITSSPSKGSSLLRCSPLSCTVEHYLPDWECWLIKNIIAIIAI